MDKKVEKFVEEWNIVQTLGEGAYGEVKLLLHQKSGEAVAMKVVDLRKSKDAKDCVIKEERIHRFIRHPNIIQLYGKREEPNAVYIFLEYAAGGELFNRIEPDIGMPPDEAQKYMKQLFAGLDYLHTKGIAHRDIKPENLLLDEHGNIKISDFGMSTIFRLKGRERILDSKCGTLPYVAPEVLEKPYHAQPADIWSCGIVFVAMLAGELPWDEPRDTSEEYTQWKMSEGLMKSPWCKLATTALSMARKILNPEPKNRPTLEQILQHPWMNIRFSHIGFDEHDGGENKRHATATDVQMQTPLVALSQPAGRPTVSPQEMLVELLQGNKKQLISFSQPTCNDNDMIDCSQLQLTQTPLTQINFERLNKRMTRFFVKTPFTKTLARLCHSLDMLGYSWTSDEAGVVTISLVDCRKRQLVFRATILKMDGVHLLDFRLSKGCGLEFKRTFLKIKKNLVEITTSVNQ